VYWNTNCKSCPKHEFRHLVGFGKINKIHKTTQELFFTKLEPGTVWPDNYFRTHNIMPLRLEHHMQHYLYQDRKNLTWLNYCFQRFQVLRVPTVLASIDTLLVVEDKACKLKLANFQYKQAGHATKRHKYNNNTVTYHILSFDQVHTSSLLSSTVTIDSGMFTSQVKEKGWKLDQTNWHMATNVLLESEFRVNVHWLSIFHS